MDNLEIYTFKIKYYLDIESIKELNSITNEEYMDILQKLYLSLDDDFVELTVSLSSSGSMNILYINDQPVVKNKFITLHNGEVTDESKYE